MRECLLAVCCLRDEAAGCCIHCFGETKQQLLLLCRCVTVYCSLHPINRWGRRQTINCGNINTWINNCSFYFNKNWSKLSSQFRYIKPPQQCLCHLCDLTWVLSCIYLSATNEVGAKPGTVEGYPSIRPYRKRQRQSFGWALCDCIWRKIGTLALISSHQPLYKYEEMALWCG